MWVEYFCLEICSNTLIIWSSNFGSSRSGVIRRILRSEVRILRSEVGAGPGSDHRFNFFRIRITNPDLIFRICGIRIRIRIIKNRSDPDPNPDLTVFPEFCRIHKHTQCFSTWKIISFREKIKKVIVQVTPGNSKKCPLKNTTHKKLYTKTNFERPMVTFKGN